MQLRELPLAKEDPRGKVKVELSVVDTGKVRVVRVCFLTLLPINAILGNKPEFLESEYYEVSTARQGCLPSAQNQLFHPFSQENPLQTGTGLGLAIVSSIVSSESVQGKIDVRSEERAGTEIKVTFLADKPDIGDTSYPTHDMMMFRRDDESFTRPTVTLVGFDVPDHKGLLLSRNLLYTYLKSWWNFKIVGPEDGDILILNEDSTLVKKATEEHDTRHSFIIMSAARGNPALMAIASDYERIGGFCRILYKPGGPYRLWTTLKLACHAIQIGSRSRCSSADGKMENGIPTSMSAIIDKSTTKSNANLFRRKSEDYKHKPRTLLRRPSMTPRATSGHPSGPWTWASSIMEKTKGHDDSPPTINIGTGGTLLKASISTSERPRRKYRVLVVEDNNILRHLLCVALVLSVVTFLFMICVEPDGC